MSTVCCANQRRVYLGCRAQIRWVGEFGGDLFGNRARGDGALINSLGKLPQLHPHHAAE